MIFRLNGFERFFHGRFMDNYLFQGKLVDVDEAVARIIELEEEQFAELDGFELRFGESEQSFLVGYNRFDNNKPMYGWIEYNGNKLL